MSGAHPIEASLDLVSERCGDLTPLVYARLFDLHPEMKPQFSRDTTGTIKGEMLARVFEIILDFIGENRYAARMVQCEVVTHAGYDVPPEVFRISSGWWRLRFASGWGASERRVRERVGKAAARPGLLRAASEPARDGGVGVVRRNLMADFDCELSARRRAD